MNNTDINIYVNAMAGLSTIEAADQVIVPWEELLRHDEGNEHHYHVFFAPFYSFAAHELAYGSQDSIDSLTSTWCELADQIIEFVRENRAVCTLYDNEALHQHLQTANITTESNTQLSAIAELKVARTQSVWEAFTLIHGLQEDDISSRVLYLEALAEPLVGEVKHDVHALIELQQQQAADFKIERESLNAAVAEANEKGLQIENSSLDQLKTLEDQKRELERKLSEQEKEAQLTLEQLFKTQELAEQHIHKLNEQQQKVDSLTEQTKADKKANDTLSKQVKTLESELKASKKELAAVIEQVEAVFLMKEQPNE